MGEDHLRFLTFGFEGADSLADQHRIDTRLDCGKLALDPLIDLAELLVDPLVSR